MPTQGIRTEAQVLNANGTGSLRPNFADASGFDGLLLEIFRWLILASTALAVVFLIIAGLQYATTDAFSKKGEAKRRIQEIMIGLALALSSVLILRFINPAILEIDLTKIGAGKKLGATDDNLNNTNYILADGGQTIANGNLTPSNSTINGGQSGGLSAEQVEALWGSNNIRINDPNRTSINGLREVAALGVVSMVQEMELDGLVITGGTESGHANGTYSHANGYKVDIGRNSNSQNWDRISSYFNNAVGQNIQPNKIYQAETDSYYMRVLLHDPEHYDVQYIPKNNP